MAEAILRSKDIPGVEVKSAGVFAQDGSEASANTKRVLEEQGLPMDHQASMLNGTLVDWPTYILTMTTNHKDTVIRMFPNASGKTYTLREFAEETASADIIDPFGGTIEQYRTTFAELTDVITSVTNRLRREKKIDQD